MSGTSEGEEKTLKLCVFILDPSECEWQALVVTSKLKDVECDYLRSQSDGQLEAAKQTHPVS